MCRSEYRYTPFGGVRVAWGNLPTNRKFTGYAREDAIGGIDFAQARYYDSVIGRFLSADTIVPNPADPQSLNRFTYALNNPLRYTDPTGHEPCTVYSGSQCIIRYFEPTGPNAQSTALIAWQASGQPISNMPASIWSAIDTGGPQPTLPLQEDPRFWTAVGITTCIRYKTVCQGFLIGSGADGLTQLLKRMVASNGDFEWSFHSMDLNSVAMSGLGGAIASQLGSFMLKDVSGWGPSWQKTYWQVFSALLSASGGAIPPTLSHMSDSSGADVFSKSFGENLISNTAASGFGEPTGSFTTRLLYMIIAEMKDIDRLRVQYETRHMPSSTH